MNARNALQALLAAGALSLALASGAQAAKAVHVSCGQTITKDTKLANDLDNCPNEGIVIGADGITLDLNGHTIDGDGTLFPGCPEPEPCDTGVLNTAHDGSRPVYGPGHDSVTIKNGSIREFYIGVYAESVSDNRWSRLTVARNTAGAGACAASNTRLRDIKATDSLDAGLFFECPGTRDVRIEHASVTGSGGTGIFVGDAHDVRIEESSVSGSQGFAGIRALLSDHVGIAHNTVSHNREIGVLLDDEADASEVSHNQVAHNADNIVVAGDDNQITKNRIADAVGFPDDPVAGFGVLIGGGNDNLVGGNDVIRAASNGVRVTAFDPDSTGPAERNVIRGNHVDRAHLNGYLIDDTANGTLVERNLAVGAGEDGINVQSPATTVTQNTANNNHDLGIEAVPGVTDGGGNKASGNGNPLQCTNVFCK